MLDPESANMFDVVHHHVEIRALGKYFSLQTLE